jgi:hypothetical protein
MRHAATRLLIPGRCAAGLAALSSLILACEAQSLGPTTSTAGGAGMQAVAGSAAGSTAAAGTQHTGGSAGAGGDGAGGAAGQGGAAGGGSGGSSAGTAGSGGAAGSTGTPLPFERLTSVSYTNGCGNKQVQAGTTTQIAAGQSFDLTAYGLEMGFHCDIDHGHFAYIELAGDFDFIARIDAVATEDGEHHARAGLMARKLPADADDMFVNVTVASNYTATHFADLRNFAVRLSERAKLPGLFYYHVDQREPPDGDHHKRIPYPREFPNEWLRLKRTGNRYMAWYGYDGVTWTEHRRHDPDAPQAPEVAWTVDLGETIALGLSLEASPEHSFTTEATARFRDIRLVRPAAE